MYFNSGCEFSTCHFRRQLIVTFLTLAKTGNKGVNEFYFGMCFLHAIQSNYKREVLFSYFRVHRHFRFTTLNKECSQVRGHPQNNTNNTKLEAKTNTLKNFYYFVQLLKISLFIISLSLIRQSILVLL